MEEKKRMPETTESVAKTKKESDTETCVCNMEWRGLRDGEDGNDCICTNETR